MLIADHAPFSCAIFLPVDVVKERLQVQDLQRDYKYDGSLDAFRTIWREEGLRGLYKGYGATIYSFGPFSAVYFALYEKVSCAHYIIPAEYVGDNM